MNRARAGMSEEEEGVFLPATADVRADTYRCGDGSSRQAYSDDRG